MKRSKVRIFWIASCAAIATWPAVATGEQDPPASWKPTVIKESLSIPETELPGLIKRAEAKETDAAIKLASYYGMYLGDTEKQIHYYEIAAHNGSEKALYNLMMIFGSLSESFNFERALQIRERLKAAVAARNGELGSDSDWAYDMYLEHFVGYGNKPRGLLFLEFAVNRGSSKAAKELARLVSDDPDVAELRKRSK